MITAIDELWFRAHPERQYRLCRLMSSKIQCRDALPPPFHTIWTITRRDPKQFQEMVVRRSKELPCDDDDLILEAVFAELALLDGRGRT
ncbi:hypothetical protein [Methylobacterium sp. CM6247]